MSAVSGIRCISTTSTPICHSPSRRSRETTLSGSCSVNAATRAAARRAIAAADRSCRYPSSGGLSSTGRPSARPRRVRSGAFGVSSSATSGPPPSHGLATPDHQTLQQLVLELVAFLLGQRPSAAGLVDLLELGPDPGRV